MKWSNTIANKLERAGQIINMQQKEEVAKKIAARAKDGDVIGFGTGSTSYLAIQAIAERIKKENLRITAIPTTQEPALACTVLGIPATSLNVQRPDWAFDGADEVDPNNNLIKGRGGALFFEKLVLMSSPENYILVDESKFVSKLGEKFPIPVEVHPMAIHLVEEALRSLGAYEVNLRLGSGKDGPVITEAGNVILDTRFKEIDSNLEKDIKCIPGVIESGLFIGYNVKIIKA